MAVELEHPRASMNFRCCSLAYLTASLGSRSTRLARCPELFPFPPRLLPGGPPVPVSVLRHATDRPTDRPTAPATPHTSVLWHVTNQATRYCNRHRNRSRSRYRSRNRYRSCSRYRSRNRYRSCSCYRSRLLPLMLPLPLPLPLSRPLPQPPTQPLAARSCCRSPSWLLPVCCHYDCHHACDSDCYPPAPVLLAALEAARVTVSAHTTCPTRVLVAAYAAPRAAFAWNHSCLCDHPVSCLRCHSHSRSHTPPRCLYRLLATRTARLSHCHSPACAVLPCCTVPAFPPDCTVRCTTAAGMTAPARPWLPQ